jgi:F-type H+-transporting ATPase subunit b
MQNILHDATFWVAVSTVLCVGFIAFKAFRPILAALDARAAAIHARLSEAESLRHEAEAVLAEYKAKSQNAYQEAESILRDAEARADTLRQRMEADMRDTIARQERSAKSRIDRMKIDAVEAVKAAIIDASLERARGDIEKQGTMARDFDTSLVAIGKRLNS